MMLYSTVHVRKAIVNSELKMFFLLKRLLNIKYANLSRYNINQSYGTRRFYELS